MNDERQVVESNDLRLEEGRGPAVPRRNDNVIEFDLLDVNILDYGLQAAYNGGTIREDSRSGNSGTDNSNKVDANDATVDDM